MFGLGLHLLHQPRPLNHVGKAGIILDIGGDRQLPAGLQALNKNWLQAGPRGIDCRRIAGRPRADDECLGVMAFGHVFLWLVRLDGCATLHASPALVWRFA